ncbi:MAG: glucose-1-phosphate cytidylyltransferase [Bacteroidota bacterium]
MKVLILAGGFGTRLAEETSLRPKPMVEIGGKPILWHIMKTYSHYGFNEFVILLGYKGYYIKEYFANYFLHRSDVTIDLATSNMEVHATNVTENWKVTLLDTGLNTMTGGRVKRAEPFINGEPFMLTYGDGVANIDIGKLVDFHHNHNGAITMTSVQKAGRFGSLKTEGDRVEAFVEKPLDGNWINAGYFVCEPKVMDYIIGGDSISLENEPLEGLTSDGQLYTFRHEGFWQCMDTLRDKNGLNKMWENGEAKWKVWDDKNVFAAQ